MSELRNLLNQFWNRLDPQIVEEVQQLLFSNLSIAVALHQAHDVTDERISDVDFELFEELDHGLLVDGS